MNTIRRMVAVGVTLDAVRTHRWGFSVDQMADWLALHVAEEVPEGTERVAFALSDGDPTTPEHRRRDFTVDEVIALVAEPVDPPDDESCTLVLWHGNRRRVFTVDDLDRMLG